MQRERMAPADAAGAGCAADIEPFEEWASRQRRRAALDGAWRVEVSERLVHGNAIRFVTSWHDNAKLRGAPLRRAQQQGRDVSARPGMQPGASAPDPQRQTARQRRSSLRSAAHHRKVRLRLRGGLLAVRFLVRLSRLTAAARALRDAPSPGKRRHSPPPPDLGFTGSRDDAALPPPPKRPEAGWLWRTFSRVRSGEG